MTKPLHFEHHALSVAVAHFFLVRRMRAMLLALLLVGCRTTWQHGATISSSSGQRLCAKHRILLVAIRAYRAPTHGDRVYLVHDADHPYYSRAQEQCPNHIPQSVSLRPSGLLREPATLHYCPTCEKEFWDILSVPDVKSAIKYVAEFPGRFGTSDTGHIPKGPYRVSLRNGVWVVRCFLDGKPLMMKIRKRDGALLDTSYPSYSSNKSLQPTALLRCASMSILISVSSTVAQPRSRSGG